MRLASILLLLFWLPPAVHASLPWAYLQPFRAGPSKRSQGCDPLDQNENESRQDCVCLGTENGRNVISVDRLSHYARLAKSFVRCRRIIGNLEITHIDQRDVDKWEALTQMKLRNATEKEETSMPVPEAPFQFLADLEEITGYLLIFNFNLTMLSLPRLRIIWGERLHDGNALQIDSNPNMRILSLPSLRTIEEGNLTIRRSPHLCYLNRPPSGGGTGRFVDYNEILSRDLDRRLSLDNFSRSCRAALPCAKKCNGHCFGPGKEHCQTVYRKNCNSSCESKACFVDDQGTSRCCDDACAGGCYAEGRDQCVACKMFEQDSKCVNQCSGTHAYNPNTLERELLPEEERRFAYGRHCVPQCPAGSLVDDEHCVSRCSWGKYRDSHRDDRQCVPCPGGVCPRVCQLQEPLDAANIQRLANCSEIEGNLELLGYAFQEHLPPGASPIPGSEPVTVPALNASQLDVLRSVRVVTGYVVLDGSRTRSKLKPRSLSFLENLEVIEGRKLYYEKYALYVIGNPDLQWLGLRSLRKIENGHVSVRQNGQLCYGQPVPFMSLLGVSENIWLNNMQQEKCERLSRKCDSNCDPASGCWGPGPAQCVRCRRFSRDGECADSCPELGYFVAPSAPTKCQRCHEQCQRCHGPSAFDCSACNNFNLWLSKVPGPVEQPLAPNMDGALPKCVAKCPNMTFVLDGQCQPCSPACRDGCTGPADKLAAGGCNRCEFAFEESKDKFRCLFGEGQDTSGVCGEPNGLAEGFFLSHEPSERTKYVCRRCRAECRSCRREVTLDSDCVCAHWQLRDAGNGSAECAMECGKGSRVLKKPADNQTVGQCQRCHSFCDPQQSCFGTGAEHCERCAFGGLPQSNGTTLCLQSCPPDFPHPDEEGFCQAHDPGQVRERKRLQVVLGVLLAILLICAVIAFLAHRWLSVKKKYVKEVQMHLPEIPPLDPMKVTQRPNMRRLNLIQINELDFAPGKSTILGQGAFGIVYAGKWRPPGVKVNIPVAIKAISPLESRGLNEEKMLHEASLMHSMQHEHLLSVAGICMGADGIKIATLLRPLGSLLRFFEQYRTQLGSKQLMLYCYQISSAMEYLTNKSVIHRDLAARNVLVKNAVHVEVTDFGLAAMLERPGDSVVISDRVAVKWLAPESLRRQIYNQRTDVWSFGVTCWEILTLGNSPYKDLGLRQDRLSRELANRLEQGYRLPQPANCSQELYEELLNCWLSDPDSRPSFRQIKQRFEQFCRAPHLYVQERQASQRALLDSTSSSDQLAMIARLLKDSDFLDPVNVNPAEYYHQQQSSRASPETVTTADCFLSRPNSASARTPPTKRCGEGMRHNSTGTSASSRYKGDPVSRKWSQPWSLDESSTAGRRTTTDEENYLMPKWGGSLSPKFIDENEEGNDGIEEEPVVEEPVELYTPVVEGAASANAEAAPCQQHSASEQYMNNREYINGVDGTATIDLLTSPLSSAADKGNTYENTGHDGKNNGHLQRQEATKAIGVGGNETAI